jgi:hypothetical protein
VDQFHDISLFFSQLDFRIVGTNLLISVSVANGNTDCGAVAAIKPLELEFNISESFFDLFNPFDPTICFHLEWLTIEWTRAVNGRPFLHTLEARVVMTSGKTNAIIK